MYFYLSSTNPNFLDRQSSYRIFFHHGSSLLEILVIYMTRFQIEPNQGPSSKRLLLVARTAILDQLENGVIISERMWQVIL